MQFKGVRMNQNCQTRSYKPVSVKISSKVDQNE